MLIDDHVADYISTAFATYVADPAMAGTFRSRFPDLTRDLLTVCSPSADEEVNRLLTMAKPLPAFDEITGLQVSIYDNPKGCRWVAKVLCWHGGKVVMKKPPFSANASLWERKRAVKEAKKLTNEKLHHPLTTDTVQMIEGLLESRPHATHIGIMRVGAYGVGTRYLDHHLVSMEMGSYGECGAMEIVSPAAYVEIADWTEFAATPKNAPEKRLTSITSNMVRQCRASNAPEMAGWASAALDGCNVGEGEQAE